jgi:hypothetical protein
VRALLLAGLLGWMLLAPSVAAGDLRLGPGRPTGVKVVGEDVRVDGPVSGRVIVLDGDLIVGPRGSVEDAVVIGGNVRTAPGGRISGEVFHVGGRWPRLRAWQIGAGLLVGLLARLILVWVLVEFAMHAASRRLAGSLSTAAGVQPLKTLGVGALAVFGVGAAALAAALTVIGLPVSAAMIGILLTATGLGIAVFLDACDASPRGRLLVTVALALPLVGDAFAALAAVIGMGAGLRHVADPSTRTATGPSLLRSTPD